MIIVKRLYPYAGGVFEVTRNSADSAEVSLNCGVHDHQEFMVGLIEDESAGWVVGRKEAGYPHAGDFEEVVEHAADLLKQECQATAQVDRFFALA